MRQLSGFLHGKALCGKELQQNLSLWLCSSKLAWRARIRGLVDSVPFASALASELRRFATLTVVRSIAFVLLLWPPAVVLYQILELLMVSGIRSIAGTDLAQRAIQHAPLDPIYLRLVTTMLADLTTDGIALQTPFWTALPSRLPATAALGWSSIVFSAQSSPLAVFLVQQFLNASLVAGGCLAVMLAYRGSLPEKQARLWKVLRPLSAVALMYAIAVQLGSAWNQGPAEIGLSMIATKIFGIDNASYRATVANGALLSFQLNLVLIVLAAAFGLGLSVLIARSGSVTMLRSCWGKLRKSVPTAGFTMVLSVGLFTSPLSPRVVFELPSPAQSAASDPSIHTQPNIVRGLLVSSQPVATQPSLVSVFKGQKGWEYWVNGKPEFIRGFGYNAITFGLSSEDRSSRYERDFREMSELGANTIVGWDEREFDSVLMAAAVKFDVGVILPFDLQPDLQYEDPDVRRALLAHVADRTLAFRGSPSLRMWGLGNEVLHAMGSRPATQSHARAFAAFLVEAADEIHRIDPSHPVIYRAAEDQFLRPIAQALTADAEPREWFVYGMNFFTLRLNTAIETGPTKNFPHALLISEFGPIGLQGPQRAEGYRELWKVILAHRDRLLGGCAYVWTVAGPEALDRNFGFTLEGGQPVDAALSVLSSLYLADRFPAQPSLPPARELAPLNQ